MSTLRSRQETWRKLGVTSASEAHAGNEFDRFGPLKKVPIRDPPKKNRLAELRKLRDLLKSGNLTPEQIHSMMRFYRNLNMFEAVERAEREGALIVPSIVHDWVLNQTNIRYAAWTGTLVIYEAPNQPFVGSVVFHWTDGSTPCSLSFQIPEEFRLRRNCALVIEHPDFAFLKIEENKYEVKLTDGAVVHLVEDFPKKDGWHKQNEVGVPYGNSLNESPEARHLGRADSNYIGLLACVHNGYVDGKQNVGAFFMASVRFGVTFLG